MSSYNKDFLPHSSKSGEHYSVHSDVTLPSPPVDRSTGSPDSFRSESSSDSPSSITDVLNSLQHRAPMVADVAADMEKPAHSYIALISMAILSSKENRTVLGEIYQFIMERFPYYNNQQKAWRNSIRHNLSINECFVKNGRAKNGKGNYWSIHPACMEDFSKGDFRRRQARRRARKSVKNVNMNQFTLGEYSCNAGYVPMTPSSLRYHPMTLSTVGYNSMTSSSRSPISLNSPPLSFQSMTSSLTGSTGKTSPWGYQPIRAQDLSAHDYPHPSFVGSTLSTSNMDLNLSSFHGFPSVFPHSSNYGHMSVY